ncbi:f-box domain protein [Colletotrichum plurivorum]|uniref:F-box domain protein n=1 Tax=Colletotrichum plurivorum TaxID=2175906 RepID=A0A8H6KVP0_9PEZI|nr:f-box domain protein [Colletotrichum plurivorum]
MASLPLELMEQICSLLCPHCQNPKNFLDREDVQAAKKTLSSLCRVSRTIGSVAQPFLFHYYSTGNVPPETDCAIRGRQQDLPREDDKLPVFLRSIIQRPDLATQIKALQLVETDEITGLTADLAPLILTESKRVGVSSQALTIEHLKTKIWLGPRSHSEAMRQIQRKDVHHWLEELAIILSPNVELFSIARDSSCQYRHIRESRVSLPSLKTVALRGVTRNQHIHEAAALFNAAPNLETVLSSRCSLFDGLSPWTLSKLWTLNLQSVSRLVLSEIGFGDLGLLVACCPGLRELDLMAVNIHRTAGEDYWDVSKLLRTLDPVRHQIGKLRLTCSPSQRSGARERRVAAETDWSFRGFEMLEELAVDQAAVEGYWRSSDDSECFQSSLVEMLPPSIRSVHLMYVHNDFLSELKHFAKDATFWFPALRTVRLSLVDGFSQDVEDIASAFGSVGIQMTSDANYPRKSPVPPFLSSGAEKRLADLSPVASTTMMLSQMAL